MTTNIIREWVLNKLKENPDLYGGDRGNPAIMRAYLVGEKKGKKVEDLTDAMFSKLSTVSRIKNLLLEVYREYDKRTDKVRCKHREQSLFEDVA